MSIHSAFAFVDPEGTCLRPIVPVSGRTAFIPCLTDFMVAWHFVASGYPRQFFQPQLSDWSRNCSRKEWRYGPSNSSLGALNKLSLFVVHSYPCGVVVSTVSAAFTLGCSLTVYFRSFGICLMCSIPRSEFSERVSAACCVHGLGLGQSVLLWRVSFPDWWPLLGTSLLVFSDLSTPPASL